MTDATPFSSLTPDHILDAVEDAGLRCDGNLMALNSFENRVWQVGQEDGPPVVVKFYRAARWQDAAILEEHAFTLELAAREIPVVAPLRLAGGQTLHQFEELRLAVYPRRGGRAPELEDPLVLEWLGRFMGRIHAVGALQPFSHRPALNIESYGDASVDFILYSERIPESLEDTWCSVAEQALDAARQCFARAGGFRSIRLHGDCHAGNVLWTPDGPHFVDFDDARMGPAVQDLWMLLSGDEQSMAVQLDHVLEGYEAFAEFDRAELYLVEALRTLRLLHFAAWLARRWDDPAFPAAFPWFDQPRYWEEHILALREQVALMEESPLVRLCS